MKYILGYKKLEDSELTLFETEKEADYEADEWVAIEADSIEEAKKNYDKSFLAWKKKVDEGEEYDKLVYEGD